MVILLEGDVLCPRARVNKGLDVFEEPGLVPQSDLVEFVRMRGLHHVACNHHGLIPTEHETLHEVVVVRPLQLSLQGLDHLLQRVHGDVV